MAEKDIFGIWNNKEERFAINEHAFGGIICFLTEEQAKAFNAEFSNQDYSVRKFTIKEA